MGQEGAPLGNRLADYVAQRWKLTPEQARGRAHQLLEQVGLDVGEHLDDFVQAKKPANKDEVAQQESEYWSKAAYWEAMDSEAVDILKAVGATTEELKASMRKPR